MSVQMKMRKFMFFFILSSFFFFQKKKMIILFNFPLNSCFSPNVSNERTEEEKKRTGFANMKWNTKKERKCLHSVSTAYVVVIFWRVCWINWNSDTMSAIRNSTQIISISFIGKRQMVGCVCLCAWSHHTIARFQYSKAHTHSYNSYSGIWDALNKPADRTRTNIYSKIIIIFLFPSVHFKWMRSCIRK